MKKGLIRIIIGSLLIFIQLISFSVNLNDGVKMNLSFESLSVFFYDLSFLFSYFFFGLLGIILLCSGFYAYIKARDKIRFCRKCGEKLVEDKLYCIKCGTEVVKE